jgi:hypothetical protein
MKIINFIHQGGVPQGFLEVSAAWMLQPSPHGRVHGVFKKALRDTVLAP